MAAFTDFQTKATTSLNNGDLFLLLLVLVQPPVLLYLNFSSSPKSTTRSSLLAHRININTNPGIYPPPTVIPSLQERPCVSSTRVRTAHRAPLTGMLHFLSSSVASSERYGTRLDCGDENAVEVSDREPYASRAIALPFPPLLPVFASLLLDDDDTGGSGRKYNIYAEERRLAIAAIDESSVSKTRRRGRYSSTGASGRSSRMCV